MQFLDFVRELQASQPSPLWGTTVRSHTLSEVLHLTILLPFTDGTMPIKLT